jgi:tetratricopeptide (TPR) repeat protein
MENKETLPKGLSLLQELTTFINKVNIKVMAGSTPDFSDKLNLISKCIDMLFYKPVRNNLRPQEKLLQLRALCFNNLSCIYKENRQNEDALRALEVALEIEEGLLDKNFEDTYKSIASTYINKCVILSHLSLHEEAIETIKTSLDNLQKYQ